MDAGSYSASSNKKQSRCPLQEQLLQRKNSRDNLDRFIPNRSAMDFDYAHYMLTEGRKGKENPAINSPSREAYRKQLAETFNMNRIPNEFGSVQQAKTAKPHRYIPQQQCSFHCSRWHCISVGCNRWCYFSPVTSVKWGAPDGRHIAVGLNNSEVQLWDTTANRLLRTLRGGHRSRVGALDWNNHILTTGGMDGQIINNDVRIRNSIVDTYQGHHQEVCGLKWSASGQQLASGGNDNLLHIWDRSTASSNSATQWLHRLEDHTAAVKALAWCPFQGNLLASGGGGSDRCIKFWNTHTGA